MWGEILCLVLGGALALGAIFGRKFYAGMSPSMRVSIPAWQGRLWFLISGGLLLLAELEGFLGPSHSGVRHFMEQTFTRLDFGYEIYVGIIAVLVGAAFLFASKGKTDRIGRLLGAGAVFGGLIFISDGLWKMKR